MLVAQSSSLGMERNGLAVDMFLYIWKGNAEGPRQDGSRFQQISDRLEEANSNVFKMVKTSPNFIRLKQKSLKYNKYILIFLPIKYYFIPDRAYFEHHLSLKISLNHFW